MNDTKLICKLRFQEAIDLITGTMRVFYRHGVWNEYKKIPTERAIEAIKKAAMVRTCTRTALGSSMFLFRVTVICGEEVQNEIPDDRGPGSACLDE